MTQETERRKRVDRLLHEEVRNGTTGFEGVYYYEPAFFGIWAVELGVQHTLGTEVVVCWALIDLHRRLGESRGLFLVHDTNRCPPTIDNIQDVPSCSCD